MMNRNMMPSQKGIAHIFLIFILLTGIIAGVFLVQKTQIFKPKAAGANIEFLENSCTKEKDGAKILICPKPKIKFISPLEVGNAQTNGFDLVKTVYAAGSGKGYYCLSDTEKIYHKEKICNPVLGIFCFTWLSSHEEEKEENCDVGYECSDSNTDILNNVTSAKCIVSPKRQSAGNLQPRFIPQSDLETQPPATPRVEPLRQPSRVPTPVPEVSPTSPPRTISQTSRTQVFQTQTSDTGSYDNEGSGSTGNDNAGSSSGGDTGGSGNTGTGTTAPNTGTGATAPNTGTGATNPPPARTTTKFRFAEDRDKLDIASWRKYTPGGTTIVEDFSFSSTPGRKAIFAQFMDGSDQIIKFDSGQEFAVAYIVLAPETSPSPSPTLSSSPSASSAPEQVACNGVSAPGSGKAGESITIQFNYKGTPAKLQVWMASNVDGWTQVKKPTNPSNSISFKIPSDMADGNHPILVSLHDSVGSMLDGNPGGVVNPKCSASLTVLPATLPPVSTSTPTPTPTPKPVDISCIGKVCTCGDTTIGDTRNPGQCSDCGSGGWCNGGKCATCSP